MGRRVFLWLFEVILCFWRLGSDRIARIWLLARWREDGGGMLRVEEVCEMV